MRGLWTESISPEISAKYQDAGNQECDDNPYHSDVRRST